MMTIRSQQILRKIGAGFLIILLLLFLTDYFRVKASYGEVSDNLEYSNVVYESIILEVTLANMHTGLDKECYYQVLNILTNNKAYPYLIGKDVYLQMTDAMQNQIKGETTFVVSGTVTSNNFGMLKMDVSQVKQVE